MEGRCVEVLEKSPLEIDSPCPHFGICGGCTYQSISYEEQCKIKETQVKNLLDGVYLVRNETPDYRLCCMSCHFDVFYHGSYGRTSSARLV